MASVMQDYPHWSLVLERLDAKQMPPASFGKQPTDKQREAVIGWIRAVKLYEAQRNAGDPGPVPPRRLSNAEYDYTIRDLTGVDVQAAKSFPIDPASGEGFRNTGEALTMSPNLFRQYYAAAEQVASHALLTTTGLRFAPHPAITTWARSSASEWPPKPNVASTATAGLSASAGASSARTRSSMTGTWTGG